MVHITFDYEPESKSVTNIKVTDLVVSKPGKAKVEVMELVGSSLKIPAFALELLNSKIGDRLCVRFDKQGPILATPDALGETGGGNLVTKSSTLLCKGKVGVELAKYGNTFVYNIDGEGILTLSGRKQVEETTQTQEDTNVEEIKSEIDSVDFQQSIEGEEVECDFGN